MKHIDHLKPAKEGQLTPLLPVAPVSQGAFCFYLQGTSCLHQQCHEQWSSS